MDKETFLLEKCAEIGIKPDQKKTNQFLLFYEHLINTNAVMNLTAITDYEEVVIKHFVDSLSIVKALPDIAEQDWQVMDLGSGAGFPGIPLKIMFPNLQITLADSLQKRVRFMNEVIERCSLKGIQAIHGRAEDLAAKEYREQYDLCVSRAVANLSTLTEYCLPFVKINGRFVAYKSMEIDEELKTAEKAIYLLGGQASAPVKYEIAGEYGRSLVVIEKIRKTPKKYPRKSGTPARAPL